MKIPSFIYQYLINPRTVGALLPSSKYLSEKMLEEIDFEKADYIVEYGPGTGVFTRKILKRRKQKTIVVLIENNKKFYKLLKERFIQEKNLIIIHGSAEEIGKFMNHYQIPYVDYVISGLPFASLPQKVSTNILANTEKVLKEDGLFVTFQYTKIKISFLKHFFPNINIKKEIRNIPPAYVFNCMKSNRDGRFKN